MGLPCITARYTRGGAFAATLAASASSAEDTGVTRESDLVGWWKSDENTGTTTADSTDGGATLTLTNGATWATGKNGSALDVDGTNDYAVSETGGVAETSPYSMSCWINIDALTTGNSTLTALWPSSGNHPTGTIVVRNQSGGPQRILFYHYKANGGYTYEYINTTVLTGAWHNFVMTFDPSSGVKGYMNGSLLSTTNAGGVPSDQKAGARTLYIGKASGWDWFLDGKVDDIRYYGVELSGSDVSDIYGSGDGDWG